MKPTLQFLSLVVFRLMPRPIAVTMILLLAVGSTNSQTKWFKYEGNPVLSVGPSGAWDGISVHPSRVVLEDSLFRMWYTGWNGTNLRIGVAVSPDGVTWSKHASNPVMSGGLAGSWESVGAMDAYVLRSGLGYEMWYTGVNASWLYAIGHATSPDEITWTKDSANPVLSQGSWYTRGPDMPSVLDGFSDSRLMWFTGEPIAHEDFQIGFALGTNYANANWTPLANPVFSYGSPGSWDDDKVFYPRVLQPGIAYEMFYVGERSNGRSQFGYATSADGKNWTRSPDNPVLKLGPSAWDAQDFYALEILFRQDIYHMWYGGTSVFGGIAWRGGYAVSPKGMSVSVLPLNSVVVRIVVRVNDPKGMQFSAELQLGTTPLDTVKLYDDGLHGDSLAADGIFANEWPSPGSNTYSVNLQLRLHDTLRFESNGAAVFTTSVSKQTSTIPFEYDLSQNYPNPFNPSTEIQFSLPYRSYVTLTIFDLLGREVATLVSEELSAGSYSTRWDAAGMPSGVYLYRLQAGEFVETKKLLLLR
ncbi:MAG: T9SS type A sorting domain-containing protein [Ignavibacteriales bacterium]|nr:T9SS type A sorting domain-containing protein [Ignavibacteriales bacterium]